MLFFELKLDIFDPIKSALHNLHCVQIEQGSSITRAMSERILAAKLRMPEFAADFGPLLAPSYDWNMEEAARTVLEVLITLLPGESRKGER